VVVVVELYLLINKLTYCSYYLGVRKLLFVNLILICMNCFEWWSISEHCWHIFKLKMFFLLEILSDNYSLLCTCKWQLNSRLREWVLACPTMALATRICHSRYQLSLLLISINSPRLAPLLLILMVATCLRTITRLQCRYFKTVLITIVSPECVLSCIFTRVAYSSCCCVLYFLVLA